MYKGERQTERIQESKRSRIREREMGRDRLTDQYMRGGEREREYKGENKKMK